MPSRRGSTRRWIAALSLALLAAAPTGAQAALTDAGGNAIGATDASPTAQLVGAPGCRTPVSPQHCALLAEPGSPADDDPAVVAGLGASGAPEDDLLRALDTMAAAQDGATAARARDEALAILGGDPLPGRPYSGIPLLNWNPAAKIRTVPAGGEVTVRQIRTPGHSLSDAWLLRFEDPHQPYSIRYRVSELGGTFGGQLKPVPLLVDGRTPIGGLHSALTPLASASLATGTHDWSRFTRERNLPAAGGSETTRLATQDVVVRMPPPRVTEQVLHPSEGPHGPSLHSLAAASDERIERAAASLGFRGGEPTPAQREAAIQRLATASPERQLADDLARLPADDDPAFLAAVKSLGAQDRAHVAAMRVRDALPDGVPANPGADVTVVLQNNETYVSRARIRPGEVLRVEVVNRDHFDHEFLATGLHDRRAVLGADDWGHFDWKALHEPAVVAAGQSRTLAVPVSPDVFTAVLGDPNSGDQAMTALAFDRGPRTQALKLGDAETAAPLHAAVDGSGDLWVTLSGSDEVVRVRPGDDLAASARTTIRIPGGAHTLHSEQPPLGPTDVAVDHAGMVWVTLLAGNAIARIDPAQVSDGTAAGVRVYPLPACDHDECEVPFAAGPAEAPTRAPLQLEVTADAAGNTVAWFTETAVDSIGALRVSPAGDELGLTEFSCGCGSPLGLTLDAGGDVWFTEAKNNRVGRLTPGVTEPFAAGDATLRHHRLPSSVRTVEPDISRLPIETSLPHSIASDPHGRLWVTEAATGKLAVLDPANLRPGTSAGITELDLPANDFKGAAVPADLAFDRAGKGFWTDEYGDAVGIVDASGPRESWRMQRSLRPVERRSLTDSPLLTPDGDLWYVESAANLLVRVAGVSAGAPGPAPAPELTVDTARGELAVSGLRETATLDLTVRRGGDVVATATSVPVRGGSARVAAASWTAGTPDMRAGDTLSLVRRGAHPQPVLEHVLPSLSARNLADGTVTGIARRGNEALNGAVDVAWTSAHSAGIDPVDGGFTASRPSGEAGAARTVSWSVATPGSRLRVVAPVAAAPQPPAAQAPAVPAPATTSPEGVAPASPRPAPQSPTAKERPPVGIGCSPRHWLLGSAQRPQPALVGMTATAITRCLGRPARRSAAAGVTTWRYPGLVVDLASRRVVRVRVTHGRWMSARGGLRVGAPARTVSAALPDARAAGPRARRAVVLVTGDVVADIRIRLARQRVASIEIRAMARDRLDAAGQALLRAAA